jgi:hypothetical protein
MHLFGDPDSPRRHLWGGAILLGLSSFQLGMTVNELFSRRPTITDYINLLIWMGMLFVSVIQFRQGLTSLPIDPKHHEGTQRGLDGPAV